MFILGDDIEMEDGRPARIVQVSREDLLSVIGNRLVLVEYRGNYARNGRRPDDYAASFWFDSVTGEYDGDQAPFREGSPSCYFGIRHANRPEDNIPEEW